MNTNLIDVFYNYNKRLKVGRLALEDRKIYFEYDTQFLKTGIELSPYKLPLKSGVFTNEDHLFDGLFGVFADCLPDGWGKLLLDRHLMSQGYDLSQITALHRLRLVGKYAIGALEFEPVIDELKDKKSIDLDELATSSLEILKGISQENIETLITNNGSSAGARPKIMVQINSENKIISANQKLHSSFEHYMVKFPSSTDHKDIGKLEYVYSLMAKDANIDIPNTKLLQGKNNSYFAIKRFDRSEDKKIHIHSLCGLVHTDFRFPTVDYDDILTLTYHLTKDTNEVVKAYKLSVFNLFTHNRDDHAKNFSFLLNEQNVWKFAPAYDLTFSFGPGGEHSTTYLNEGSNPTKEHLEKLALKHGIKEYKTIINEIYNVTKNFKKYASDVGISKSFSNDVFGHFMKKDS